MGRAVALIHPTHGHVTPALAVIEELVRRGEEVEFHGTPRWQARVEHIGARFREYGAGDRDFDPIPPTEGLLHDMSRLLTLTERLLPELLASVRGAKPDYLLVDTKSVWGRLVGQALGLPTITLSVVFAIDPGLVGVPELVRWLCAGAPPETLVEGLQGFERYGQTASRLGARYATVAPDIIEFLGNPQPLNIVFTSREFQIRGDAFGDAYRFVGVSIADDRRVPLDDSIDLDDSRPLVYVSLGTTFNDAPAFYASCFDAFAGLPCRVLISTGGRELELPAPPPNVTVRPFVPQLAVLEHADVFVTHGGMNSANEGLYFGVPMVVVPQRGDQYLVASRMAELGAGVPLSRAPGADELRAAVEGLLAQPRFRERARALGRTLKDAGGYARAADEILAHTRDRRWAAGPASPGSSASGMSTSTATLRRN